MLNKTKINLSKKITTIFFTVFLLVGFLNFGNLPEAQAACNYGITRFDSQSTVNKSGSLNINATVTRQGTSGSCANSVNLVVYIKANYSVGNSDGSTSEYNQLELTRKVVNFNNFSTQNVAISFSLNSLDWSNVQNQNQIQLFGRLYANNSLVQESGLWPVSVTGSTGTNSQNGSRDLIISFDKAEYSKDDNIKIGIKLNNFSNPVDVEVITTVNGSKIVGLFNLSASNLITSSGATGQDVKINIANGFKDGANSVLVQMFENNSNRKVIFAEGTGILKVKGLGTTSTSNNSTKLPNNSTCSDSSVCQSNLCWDDGSKSTCQACSSNDDCNSGGVTGFTCNTSNGSCVSSSTSGTPSDGSRPPATGTDILYNPLPVDSLTATLLLIAKGFLGVIAIWASVFIVVGGFQMVMSAGNEEAVLKAKKTITWAVLGLVVAIMSFSIVAIVQNLFKATVKEVPLGREISVTKNIL